VEELWSFIDTAAAFKSGSADKVKGLYFPLCNERLMSSLTPDLHGDSKSSQDTFLLEPVSRVNLISSRSSRNFWVYIDQETVWSACGVSKNLKQIKADRFELEAGLLWQKAVRENKRLGLQARISSFIPSSGEPVEVMQVVLTNTGSQKIKFTPYAAIPLYARSAANIRDHRQVTSLLQRVTLHKYGVIARPTLCFDETGHRPNKEYYFVLGLDGKGKAPEYIYPTQEMFYGEGGDPEAPEAVLNNILPGKDIIQGKEPMGGLRFKNITLGPGQSACYIILMGIAPSPARINRILRKFSSPQKTEEALKKTRLFWEERSRQIDFVSGDPQLGLWLRWVNIQPALRKVFGCSFLPDFDYGRGGRGWRDLWQDCLGLLLNEPRQARALLLNNFRGVRLDGSNATIVGKKPGEFIADRNAIPRVWMDHGAWPLLTMDLYIQETGDLDILFAQAHYFRDQHAWRSAKFSPAHKKGKPEQGTVFEHLLVQNLAQFFNVGSHNHILLEGADWNDGLDMAKENGESVAFSCLYAQNLDRLAELLLKTGKKKVVLAQEVSVLLRHFNYADRNKKRRILEDYFARVENRVSGKKIAVNVDALCRGLKVKALWMAQHIRKNEWLKEGFFNGYYDNRKRRVEGRVNGLLRMCLASQVFPLVSGIADKQQAARIISSVNKYLLDKQLKGYHLNTDFRKEEPDLGRAFSFSYGDKENGAIFSHMVVMYAYALYVRGYAKEGWKALSSLYKLAVNTGVSRIYPCLPEYFNAEGRGMYSYLTGSASWFILTLATQAFGIRGENGDLLIEPKLIAEQFGKSSVISIERSFAGAKLRVSISNPRKLDYGEYGIVKAALNSQPLPLSERSRILISRNLLRKNSFNSIKIILG